MAGSAKCDQNDRAKPTPPISLCLHRVPLVFEHALPRRRSAQGLATTPYRCGASIAASLMTTYYYGARLSALGEGRLAWKIREWWRRSSRHTRRPPPSFPPGCSHGTMRRRHEERSLWLGGLTPHAPLPEAILHAPRWLTLAFSLASLCEVFPQADGPPSSLLDGPS